MTEPVLRIKNLTKAFGGLVAVDKVNFELPGGDLRAIIGPNGAGKTTFFNLISGMLSSDAGARRACKGVVVHIRILHSGTAKSASFQVLLRACPTPLVSI